ncbi:hypothetical protein SUGI_1021740 [Cryptomeria japonica]|nr:hypothetical protein SUGI_1021740 [Cryptomeria japonica]
MDEEKKWEDRTNADFNTGDFSPCLEWLELQGLRQRVKNVSQQLDAVFHKIIAEHEQRKGRCSAEEEDEERHKDLVDVLVDTEITLKNKKAILMVRQLSTLNLISCE